MFYLGLQRKTFYTEILYRIPPGDTLIDEKLYVRLYLQPVMRFAQISSSLNYVII